MYNKYIYGYNTYLFFIDKTQNNVTFKIYNYEYYTNKTHDAHVCKPVIT